MEIIYYLKILHQLILSIKIDCVYLLKLLTFKIKIMIHKNATINGSLGVTAIIIGHGTVRTQIAIGVDSKALLFKTIPQTHIGHKEASNGEVIVPEAVIVFHNVEGLDVIIKNLKKIKKSFKK